MKYTEIAVRVLHYLSTNDENMVLNGKQILRGHLAPLDALARAISEGDSTCSPRLVDDAIEEALELGLVRGERLTRLSEPLGYRMLEITGQGRRFLEALEYHAHQEKKSKAWLWTMIERAGTLANLVSAVVGLAK